MVEEERGGPNSTPYLVDIGGVGKPHIPHCPSLKMDRALYTRLGLPPISLSFWVGI